MWLDGQQISYIERNLQADPDAMAALEAVGSRSVPTTIIHRGDEVEVFIGFPVDALTAALLR